jgi:hypothetical protein
MSDLPVKPLQALYWAELHMRDALYGCKHLLALQSDKKELVRCIYTGIVICYARSFGENHGLSKISADFHQFHDERLQTLHKFLLDSRNTIYAHKDLTREGEHLPAIPPEEYFQQIEIDIPKSGVIEWHVSGPVVPVVYLEDIAALCEFQIARLNASSTKMLQHFCEQKSYSPGRYILSDSFP